MKSPSKRSGTGARAGAAAALVALLALGACTTVIDARPIEIEPAARADYDRALALRASAHQKAGEDARAEFEAALASARSAAALAPADFRLAVLVQDLEFELDPRMARERYAPAPAGTATTATTAAEKTLAARALLPQRTADARELLVAASNQDPDFAWAWYGLAFVERSQGRTAEALGAAEKALDLDPTLVEALRLLAELYESGADRERAILAREELIEVTGGDLLERQRFAQLLLDSDRKSDATDAEKQLELILAEAGDPPAAGRRELARDALLDLGTAWARRNNVERAIEYWRKALAVDPDCLTALYNIGITELKQRQDPRAALAAFEEYLARAQGMSAPLPSDQVIFRHFYVPHHVFDLRQQLGLPTDAGSEQLDAPASKATGGAP